MTAVTAKPATGAPQAKRAPAPVAASNRRSKPVQDIAHVPEQLPVPAGADGGVPSLLGFVAMAVRDPNIDVAKLEALLRMQREIVADDAKTQFNQAMARLQPRLPRITKRGRVEYPVNKNQPDGPKALAFTYARWEDVDTAIRPILNSEGFALSFNTRQRVGDGGGLVVVGELLHVGGHAKTAEMALPLDTSGGKSNLQGYASSTSFGSRYVAKMLLNLVFEGEDDDGTAGGKSYINEHMKERIVELLQESKADVKGFLDFMHASCVDEIEVADYTKAVNALQTKLRQVKQKAPPADAGEPQA